MFAPDELIAALSDGGVDYVLIGGLAVGAHGFPRATKDVDIVPRPRRREPRPLGERLRVIEAHNFGTGDFNPDESRSTHRRILSGEFGGGRVAYLGTDRDLGVILEVFGGTPDETDP
jgi:hypothetical protein